MLGSGLISCLGDSDGLRSGRGVGVFEEEGLSVGVGEGDGLWKSGVCTGLGGGYLSTGGGGGDVGGDGTGIGDESSGLVLDGEGVW